MWYITVQCNVGVRIEVSYSHYLCILAHWLLQDQKAGDSDSECGTLQHSVMLVTGFSSYSQDLCILAPGLLEDQKARDCQS